MPTPKTKAPLPLGAVPTQADAVPNGVELRKPVRLGINLFDLLQLNEFIRGVLLAGKVDLSKAIPVDKDRPDERLIEFSCDLLQAAMTIDLIRNEGRQEEGTICRAYMKKGDTWTKLPVRAVLAISTLACEPAPQWTLNPVYFPIVEEIAPLSAPKPERVLFKKGTK